MRRLRLVVALALVALAAGGVWSVQAQEKAESSGRTTEEEVEWLRVRVQRLEREVELMRQLIVQEIRHSAKKTRSAPEASPVPTATPGVLSITGKARGFLYVDGVFMGVTPLLNLPVSAGSHHISVVEVGTGVVREKVVRVEPGGSLEVSADRLGTRKKGTGVSKRKR